MPDPTELLPVGQFDESVQIDDPKPFERWQPSPRQIRDWGQQILDALTPDERQRRLRVNLRPQVKAADGRLVAVTAADYDHHQDERERIAARATQ